MSTAVYEFTCICGQHFEVDDPVERCCPTCARSLVVDWPRTPMQPQLAMFADPNEPEHSR